MQIVFFNVRVISIFLMNTPLLFFDCSIVSNNKKKLLKKFSINSKNKNEILNLNVEGNLNILNRKINLKKLSMNKNYKASKEDLKFFKEKFENILFDKSFLEIFDYKKIKKFILEILNYFGLVILRGLIILSYSFSLISPL